MALQGAYAFQSPIASTDNTLSKAYRDALLNGVANSGVRFLFDLQFGWCYPGGPIATRGAAGAPSNGAAIADMAELADGTDAVPAGSQAYSGGGFDLTSSSGVPSGVLAPASALADIATAYGGKVQRYLCVGYFKLPTSGNWNATGTILSIMGDKSYQAAASLLTISQSAVPNLNLRRQTAAATADSVTLVPAAGDYGTVVQLAAWRNDAGQGLRLKTANGTILTTAALGADNTQDFSANQFCWGRPNAFTGAGTGVITAMTGLRVYRGWIENLARSGRDPAATLDADYARVIARAVFS